MRAAAAVPAPLLCLLALVALTPPSPARAQEREPEMILPACGILYPGGYDPNTVGVVEGRVFAFNLPEQGPVSFRLEAAVATYTVLAAPAWYWAELKLELRDGDRVRVKGSKSMGADGKLYLVAQELLLPGVERHVLLRDTQGVPVWSGHGPGGPGGHRPVGPGGRGTPGGPGGHGGQGRRGR